MRFIQDEHRTCFEFLKEVAKASQIGFVRKDTVRNDESGPNAPWISREATGSARLKKVFAVDDCKIEAELLRQFVLPLQQHGSRCCDNDDLYSSPQQHFANDKSCLNCLAQSDIVGNQKVNAREI